MNGLTPEPLGTPYCDGSQLDFVTRCTVHVRPPSGLPKYVTSNWVLPLQLRSLAMRSMRPLPGSMLISTLMRSPAPGATTCGADHLSSEPRLAYVTRICARPATISV